MKTELSCCCPDEEDRHYFERWGGKCPLCPACFPEGDDD